VGELVELKLPARSFDAVTAWHCLEHMRDPFAAIREIGCLLKPGGVLLIAVPNRHNVPMAWLYRCVKGRPYPLFSLSTKEIHLFHFTPSSLRQALQQAGFQVLRVGWDNGMVEPLKRVVDYVAALPYVVGGRLWTEAMLVWARAGG
jgi:2-polyprenyl-3-methyl-5-hydroxy-6-metoxy-1,4-benzoquinol methylase